VSIPVVCALRRQSGDAGRAAAVQLISMQNSVTHRGSLAFLWLSAAVVVLDQLSKLAN